MVGRSKPLTDFFHDSNDRIFKFLLHPMKTMHENIADVLQDLIAGSFGYHNCGSGGLGDSQVKKNLLQTIEKIEKEWFTWLKISPDTTRFALTKQAMRVCREEQEQEQLGIISLESP